MKTNTLSSQLLHRMDASRRATIYLSVGKIYLYDNPLLKEQLKLSHVILTQLGYWGTTPGQNFIDVHLNRVIKKYDLDMIYVAGPGSSSSQESFTKKVKPCQRLHSHGNNATVIRGITRE